MIPREYSSGGRQRLGGLSKQGNPLLRFLWGEAGAHAVRRDPELQRFYRRKLIQKGFGKASVAVARKLGIRLWIMLRDQIEYNEFCRRGQKQQNSSKACAGMPETRHGAKMLWWDGDGLCLFAKRLERGRFLWPQATSGTVALTPAQLSMLLEGIDWRRPVRSYDPQMAV
jgi:hypothetical protein